MLFNPLQVGSLTLPNRILLAPLTRARADAGHMPNALMAEYYSQRATGGLLISECTMVAPGTSAFVNVMLPLFFGVLSSLLTRSFCAVPRTSVARIAWD